ncbi:hypothetical protein V1264_004175 [Littorina saxatilis]|uniref:Uncharacterized protein n=1 Tax=Littorina saxatilis TaxID=31220 RepID=A0AAN9G6W6_9CAEN
MSVSLPEVPVYHKRNSQLLLVISSHCLCSCHQNLTVEDDEACDDRCPGPGLPFRACSCSAGTKPDADHHCEFDVGEHDRAYRFARPKQYGHL